MLVAPELLPLPRSEEQTYVSTASLTPATWLTMSWCQMCQEVVTPRFLFFSTARKKKNARAPKESGGRNSVGTC